MAIGVWLAQFDMLAGGHIDSTNTARQAALARAGGIDMADIRSADEFLDGVFAFAGIFPKPQKDIVMSVKNALHSLIPACMACRSRATYSCVQAQGDNTAR